MIPFKGCCMIDKCGILFTHPALIVGRKTSRGKKGYPLVPEHRAQQPPIYAGGVKENGGGGGVLGLTQVLSPSPFDSAFMASNSLNYGYTIR